MQEVLALGQQLLAFAQEGLTFAEDGLVLVGAVEPLVRAPQLGLDLLQAGDDGLFEFSVRLLHNVLSLHPVAIEPYIPPRGAVIPR